MEKTNRTININPIEQPVVLYTIMSDAGKIAGYVLITVSTKHKKLHIGPYKVAMIWHIHVDKPLRKQGYAKCLILSLQQTFDEIFTDIDTEEGRLLLESAGFISETRNGVPVVVWYKG